MNHAHTQRWANRTDFGDEPNALASAVAEARALSKPLIDLTVSNPTRCGFEYDATGLLAALATPDALQYEANPLGTTAARRAVAEHYYGPRGISLNPDRLVLTSSTSEAYGYLMRLLCNAGDEILVPEPSYPLFDLLARIEDVELVRYPLRLHDGWRVDWDELRRRVSAQTRAVVVVHPNNPTGHTADAEERARFLEIAEELRLSLIVDEVFLDFPIEAAGPLTSFAGALPVLTFVLSGVSKVLGLPQMKLAWTAVCGPEAEVAEAMHRLSFVADTFLSVNGPVQGALQSWLPLGGGMRAQIQWRVRANLARLDGLLRGSLCSRLPVMAGWCVLLRVPEVLLDEELAVRLVRVASVVTHPGSFYGMARRGWLVLSLLVPFTDFEAGVTQLLRGIEASLNNEPGM